MSRSCKWFLAFMLILVFVFCAMPCIQAETVGGTWDTLSWSISDDGTLSLSGEWPLMESVTGIPWTEYSSGITGVDVAYGITKIGDYAFTNCMSLTYLNISDSVTEIGSCAFQGCSNLSDIMLDDNISQIGRNAFPVNCLLHSHCTSTTASSLKNMAYSYQPEHLPQNIVIDTAIPTTCTEEGLTEGSHCTACNAILVAQERLPATGHSFEDDICSACGKEYEELKVEIELDKYEMNAGDPLNVTYRITGGTGLYTVEQCWYYYSDNGIWDGTSYNVPNRHLADDTFSISRVNTGRTRFKIQMTVSDSDGAIGNAESKEVLVHGISVDSFEVDKEAGLSGETVNVTYSISGGIAPYTITPEIRYYVGDQYIYRELDPLNAAEGFFSFELPATNSTVRLKLYISDSIGVYRNSNDVEIAVGTTIKKTISGKCGMLDWTLSTDGVLTISGNGNMPDSPTVWDNYKNSIEKIVVENGVTSIGDNAFSDFKRLVEVSLADTVRQIRPYAFSDDVSLMNIDFGEGVETIDGYAFAACKKLQCVDLPASLETICLNAFSNSGLRQLNIPTGVRTINSGINMLESITVAEENQAYRVTDGVLFTIDMQTLVCWPGRKTANEYEIPAGVKKIDGYAFYGADISRILLPDSITSISGSAFVNSAIQSIRIPVGVKYIPYECFRDCLRLTLVSIPDTVTSIEYNAFGGCTSLTQIYIPNSVTSISSNAIPKTTTILCEEDSNASKWADSYDLKKQKHEHEWEVLEEKEVSCTENGYCSYICVPCNSVKTEIVEKPGHEFVDGVCTRCNEGYRELKVEIELDKYEMNAGDPLTVTYRITGGTGLYTVENFRRTYRDTDGNGGSYSPSVPDKHLANATFFLDSINTGYPLNTIQITVRDSDNAVASAETPNLVVHGISIDRLEVDKEFAMSGETVTVRYAISGGNPPYTISPTISGIISNQYFSRNLDQINDEEGLFSFELPAMNGDLSLLLYVRDRKDIYQYSKAITIAVGQVIKKTVSGKCGLLDWELSTDGVLTISGEGEIPNSPTVWNDYKNSVEKIVIESGTTSIGSRAFENFKRLNEVTIADTVQSIQSNAFNNCGQLQSIDLPSSLTSFNFSAIANTAIQQITIPEGVQSISAGTNQLESITVAEGNTAYCVEDGVLFSKAMQTLVCWPGKKTANEYRIPANVQTIGSYAFYGANISRVVIPDTVKDIGSQAFANSMIHSIDIPSGVEYISYSCFNSCSQLVSVSIPETVKSIGDYAFSGCTSLTQLYIPNSVTSIPSNAIPKTTTVLCTEGSYASRWADSYDVGKQAHEHEWVLQEEKVVSCMEDGYGKYVCATCGTVKTETTQKTGHEFVDGVCVYCGEEYQEMQIVLEPDRTTANVDEIITMTYHITGGSGIYTINKLDLHISDDSRWELLYCVADIHAATGSVSYTPDQYAANAYYSIRVTDSLGNVKTARSEPILIDGCHFTELAIDKKNTTIGDTVHIEYAIEGGTAPYTLSVRSNYFPTDDESYSEEETLNDVMESGTLTYQLPSFSCGVGYDVCVTDANGHNCWGEYQFVWANQTTVVNVKTDKKTVQIGEPITFTWETIGATGPYSLACGNIWYKETFVDGEADGETYVLKELVGYLASDSVTVIPTAGTELCIQLDIEDSRGRYYCNDSEPITITGSPMFTTLKWNATADKATVQYGEPVTVNYSVSGWAGEFTKITIQNYLHIGGVETYYQSPIINMDPVQTSGQVVFTPVVDAHIRERAIGKSVQMRIVFQVEDQYGHSDYYYLDPITVEGDIIPFKPEETTLRGDINGDGMVDGRDAIRLKKWIEGQTVDIHRHNADLDGDLVISENDLTVLLSELAQ